MDASHVQLVLLAALALWRCVSVVTAQMNDVAVWIGALTVGIGVGFTSTGAATGFSPSGGPSGKFSLLCPRHVCRGRPLPSTRDASGARTACGTITAVALVVAWCGLTRCSASTCSGEAWKSSPLVHYNQFTVESAVEGVDASPRSLFFAACFRAFTYVYAVVVGVAFLGSLPRVHVPLVTDSGTRTMYGYLVHAPALLALLAQWRVPIRGYRRRPRGARVADVGVLAPVAVTEACMTAPVARVFWCEPKLGKWVWR